ncbi:MAG: aspartate--tRNA ligase [bacterium]|nr:aspartate--tRNA ligase [bacterium]
MFNLKRTHYGGQLRLSDVGTEVILNGWVAKRRDHGGLVFIDLRDRSGIAQVVFNPEHDQDSHVLAHQLRSEFVVAVKGTVETRPKGTVNPELPTGEIEVLVSEMEILNPAKTPPFPLEEKITTNEDLRLQYRYLDLRRPGLKENILARHKAYQAIRNYLAKEGLLEIETPMLIASTPEGARDFLVPSRLLPGSFYALPQSPQLFKQILMVAGMEGYFQIVKCFRDEDLRADRQPEFTQIDIEASFVDEEDIYRLIEGLLAEVFKALLNIDISLPFPRLTYQESMDRFGVDRPDTRFGLELFDAAGLLGGAGFKVFDQIIEQGGQVKGICIPGGAAFSRKDIDDLTTYVAIYGAKGLAYFKVTEEGLESPIAKFFSQEKKDELIKLAEAKAGDIIFFVADKPSVVAPALANLRLNLAERLGLIPGDKFELLWVTDFPLLEYDEEEKRWVASHHPFTSPKETDYHLLETDPGKIKARAYDIVLNGVEIGGGSIRIHRQDIQEKAFSVLGITLEEARRKFGFLLEAFEYGAPPHGGIALGLDRLLAVLLGCESIRDVIAFPKTQSGGCPLTGAPFEVEEKQLRELHLKIRA